MNFQFSIFNFQKRYVLLIFIILIAGFLRLYKLGINPPSLDWDEASLGYNAYSILKTGKDEFGRFLPISIRSFEDYKPAVYVYLTVPSIAVFGLNEFAVRLPSAILGTLTVFVVYFLVQELILTENLSPQMRDPANHINQIWAGKLKSKNLALLTAMLLTISPWHLQFSRVAFEANVALFFVVSGMLFFHKGLKNGYWLLLSSLLFTISFYSYHSPRLMVPLLLLGWVVYFRRQLWQVKRWVIISFFLGCILLVPFIQEAVTVGRARLGSVTSLNPNERLGESIKLIEADQKRGDRLGIFLHNRRIIYGLAIIQGYLDHFNLDFLFLRGDAPLRHHAPDMGMLYLWEAPFILMGVLLLLKTPGRFPLFWWFVVAPAASSITSGTPHAVRALLYLPIYQIIAATGLLFIISHIRHIGFVGIIAIASINIFYYFDMYYIHAPIEAAKEWQYGYKQAVVTAKSYENQVDRIVVTYAYDQPHVYVLFYGKVDPVWYQSQVTVGEVKRFGRSFGKYEFRMIDWSQDKNLKNTLLVGTPGEIPEDVAHEIPDILYPDGTVAFRSVKL